MLSAAAALASLVVLWVGLHIANFLSWRRHPATPLPLSTPVRASHRYTTVTLRNAVHLRLQTTAWNRTYDLLSAALRRRDRALVRAVLSRFYDAGVWAGVAGMAVAFALLAWTCVTLAVQAMPAASLTNVGQPTHDATVAPKLVRRDVDHPGFGSHVYRPVVKPIVPGITVPLGHLPIVLAALVLNQVAHEFGHFLAAALTQTPLHHLSVTFTLVLPTFATVLSTPDFAALAPSARARVIAAGPWHNLVLWGLLALLSYVFRGGPAPDTYVGGRMVLGVDSDSPLRAHLPPGTLITALDDTRLSPANATHDPWSAYLLSAHSTFPLEGWCVDHAWYHDQGDACCAPTGTHPAADRIGRTDASADRACFTSHAHAHAAARPQLQPQLQPHALRCVDPVPILARPGHGRCAGDARCGDGRMCVRPAEGERLMRLVAVMPGRWGARVTTTTMTTTTTPQAADMTDAREVAVVEDAESEVILWSGPRREVWEQLSVSEYAPPLLARAVPQFLQAGFEYLKIAALSLFLFNLLPLPMLDGSQLLGALFDGAAAIKHSRRREEEIDLEEGFLRAGTAAVRGNNSMLRRRDGLLRVAEIVTSGMCLVCMLTGVLDLIR